MATVRSKNPGTEVTNAVRSGAKPEPVKRVIVASTRTGATLEAR